MQLSVTGTHAVHDLVPGAFDRRAIGTQLMHKARSSDHALAGGDVRRKTDANTDRHNAEVNADPHQPATALDRFRQLTG